MKFSSWVMIIATVAVVAIVAVIGFSSVNEDATAQRADGGHQSRQWC
jgi:hypothetical protein